MTEYCKEMVPARKGARSSSSHACPYKAKRDGYCGVHRSDAVWLQREESAWHRARWPNGRCKSISEGHRCIYAMVQDRYCIDHHPELGPEKRAFNRRAGDRCRELGIEPEEIKA